MIALFTDFGAAGPYTGQVEARLLRDAPGVDIVDLLCDAPRGNPKASAYLLAAYDDDFPAGTVFLSVVDPGVGGGRLAVMLEADGRWYVGPDNGLLEIVARQASGAVRWSEITWRPERLSATFHGRDLFAPVAAMLARGDDPPARPLGGAHDRHPDWPDDLDEIVFVDVFGNAMTGRRGAGLGPEFEVVLGDTHLTNVETYSDVSSGEAFCYVNANGLVEIAVNGGDAAALLSLKIGDKVEISVIAKSR